MVWGSRPTGTAWWRSRTPRTRPGGPTWPTASTVGTAGPRWPVESISPRVFPSRSMATVRSWPTVAGTSTSPTRRTAAPGAGFTFGSGPAPAPGRRRARRERACPWTAPRTPPLPSPTTRRRFSRTGCTMATRSPCFAPSRPTTRTRFPSRHPTFPPTIPGATPVSRPIPQPRRFCSPTRATGACVPDDRPTPERRSPPRHWWPSSGTGPLLTPSHEARAVSGPSHGRGTTAACTCSSDPPMTTASRSVRCSKSIRLGQSGSTAASHNSWQRETTFSSRISTSVAACHPHPTSVPTSTPTEPSGRRSVSGAITVSTPTTEPVHRSRPGTTPRRW